MSFFGLATLSAYGMFDWQGQFAVGLSGDLLLGTHDFGIEGQFSINTSFYWTNPSTQFGVNFDINGSASVSARLFGITFASLGVNFDANIATNTGGTAEVSLSVTVHIHILFITISATAHFDIGTIQFPKPFYLAGDQSNAQVWDSTVDDGTLYLNTGSRASTASSAPRATPIPRRARTPASRTSSTTRAARRRPARRSRSRRSVTARRSQGSSGSSMMLPTRTTSTASR